MHIRKLIPLLVWLTIIIAGIGAGNYTYKNESMVTSLEISLILACVLSQRPDPKLLRLAGQFRVVSFALVCLVLGLTLELFDFRPNHSFALALIGIYIFIFFNQRLITIIKENLKLFLLVFSWMISTTASYYFSPIDEKAFMWLRYQQTLIHVLTFFALWAYFRQQPLTSGAIFSAIPLSATAVALITLALYFSQNGNIGSYDWFTSPPFNSHIRHAGYFFTAALAVLLPLFSISPKPLFYTLCLISLAIVLWSCLLWAGGRTATASIILTTIIGAIILVRTHKNAGRFLTYSFATLIIGLFISEWISVFPWNGMKHGVVRTISAENIEHLSNSRLTIWAYSLDSIKENLFWGLGANSYFSIPDRFRLTGQPHSMLIQFLLEWGLVGTTLFVTMLLLILKKGLLLLIKPEESNATNNTGLIAA